MLLAVLMAAAIRVILTHHLSAEDPAQTDAHREAAAQRTKYEHSIFIRYLSDNAIRHGVAGRRPETDGPLGRGFRTILEDPASQDPAWTEKSPDPRANARPAAPCQPAD